jgi:glucose-6-phosphate dehydrogenase assembly protein OpcA
MPASQTINPDHILKELSAHWTELSKGEHQSATDSTATKAATENGGVLRACSMTLICFADDEEDAQTLSGILVSLVREHPSRLIVVRLQDSDDVLSASVSAQCWVPFGAHRHICCEQVEVTASINRLGDVASIVAPLAAADLPRVIIMRSARIVRAGALRKILPLGDKVIVDSSLPGAPGFGELGGLLDVGHMAGDLAWTRLTPIRALLAQLLADRVSSPKTADIVIEYAGKEAGPGTRYLQAWLETALPHVSISLRGNGAVDECQSVPKGTPAVIRIDNDVVVRLCPGGADYDVAGMHQRASMRPGTDERLLSEELGIVVRDRVFERALNHITA